MNDSMKKLLEAENRIREFAENLDIEKKLAFLSAPERLAKGLSSLDSMSDLGFPRLQHPEPIHIPTITSFEENNHFQSAGVLLRRLADSIAQWRSALPENVQPAIIAILHGGIQIDVDRLVQESFHGIRVEGCIQGSPCVVLAHQSTVQLLCFVQPIQPPERPRRPIGFIIDGQESVA